MFLNHVLSTTKLFTPRGPTRTWPVLLFCFLTTSMNRNESFDNLSMWFGKSSGLESGEFARLIRTGRSVKHRLLRKESNIRYNHEMRLYCVFCVKLWFQI